MENILERGRALLKINVGKGIVLNEEISNRIAKYKGYDDWDDFKVKTKASYMSWSYETYEMCRDNSKLFVDIRYEIYEEKNFLLSKFKTIKDFISKVLSKIGGDSD